MADGFKTTAVQDQALGQIAVENGGGCAITAQAHDGAISVNAADGSRWKIESNGRVIRTRKARS